jgi:hypothetical protein
MMSPAREAPLNKNMLDRKLRIADELDRFIAEWKRLKGQKPSHIHISKQQLVELETHAVEGASLDNWNGIPLKVLPG